MKQNKPTNDICDLYSKMSERERRLAELQCLIMDAYNKIEDMIKDERKK